MLNNNNNNLTLKGTTLEINNAHKKLKIISTVIHNTRTQRTDLKQITKSTYKQNLFEYKKEITTK